MKIALVLTIVAVVVLVAAVAVLFVLLRTTLGFITELADLIKRSAKLHNSTQDRLAAVETILLQTKKEWWTIPDCEPTGMDPIPGHAFDD